MFNGVMFVSERSVFIREFEEQILALEKKVEALQHDVAKLGKEHEDTRRTFASIAILSEMQSTVGFALAMSSWVNTAGAAEEISSFVKSARGFLDQGFLTGDYHAPIKAFISTMIAFARAKEVPFDTLAAVLIRDFGDSYAKQLVDVTALVQTYGIANANEWKKMVGIN